MAKAWEQLKKAWHRTGENVKSLYRATRSKPIDKASIGSPTLEQDTLGFSPPRSNRTQDAVSPTNVLGTEHEIQTPQPTSSDRTMTEPGGLNRSMPEARWSNSTTSSRSSSGFATSYSDRDASSSMSSVSLMSSTDAASTRSTSGEIRIALDPSLYGEHEQAGRASPPPSYAEATNAPPVLHVDIASGSFSNSELVNNTESPGSLSRTIERLPQEVATAAAAPRLDVEIQTADLFRKGPDAAFDKINAVAERMVLREAEERRGREPRTSVAEDGADKGNSRGLLPRSRGRGGLGR